MDGRTETSSSVEDENRYGRCGERVWVVVGVLAERRVDRQNEDVVEQKRERRLLDAGRGERQRQGAKPLEVAPET